MALSSVIGAMALSIFSLESYAAGSEKATVAPLELKQPDSATPWARYGDWPRTNYNTLEKWTRPLGKQASPEYEPPPKLEDPITPHPCQ